MKTGKIIIKYNYYKLYLPGLYLFTSVLSAQEVAIYFEKKAACFAHFCKKSKFQFFLAGRTHIHTYIHTYIHTHIHTYIQG